MLRRELLAGAGAVGMLALAPRAKAQGAKIYSVREFFETTSYRMAASAGHAFSPDGRKILISSDATGVFNVYALPAAGGAPQPLTDSKTNATFAASYFPTDERVLFTADQGGDELNHVYVRETSGQVRDLTPGQKLKAAFVGWSAGGDTFYVTSNERDPQFFDLYAYSAKDYGRKLLFQNPGFTVGAISPDGRWAALVKARSSANNDIYLADLSAGGEPKLITEHPGSVEHTTYGFTPDSKALIYGTDQHGEFTQAWTYDLATGAKAALIKADWDVMYVIHGWTGRYRVHAVNADASTAVTIVDAAGRVVTLSGAPAGDLGGVRFSNDEQTIAFTVASDTSPADVFVASLADGKARRLTTALNPAIREADLVEATVARFKSYDGLEVPGVLYRPKGASKANPVPALVWVHGGPGGQSRRGYIAEVQNLVNKGYAVYMINNRGSSGYGKTFYHLDDKKHGDVDLKDVTASAAWLKSLDWVADDRIGIIGGSYGGYMVAAALAFSPQTFDAGVDIFGVTNWVRTLKAIPPWWGDFKTALYDEMGDPATDEARHRAISPLFHAKNIRKPLLVVQGANDPRVLQVESDELVAAVKANGVPVEYVVFPDEGHGFQRRANRITASEAYIRFLDTHLKRKA
jgi:dipeptidyl aminopeptidase/acylaminoacyl peptidase